VAHYRATIDCAGDPKSVFEYMADFSNAALWDPTVTRVETDPSRELGVGSRFEVFLGTRLAELRIDYETTRYEPDRCVVFVATTDVFRSLDTIEIEATRSGCRVHYDADLRFFGPAKLLDLPAHLAFQLSGRRSLDGLERSLSKIA